MEEITKKEKILIALIIILVLIVAMIKMKPDSKKEINKSNEEIISLETDEEMDESEKDLETTIMVHISGGVKNPGLIELESKNSRLKDAIEKSGGLVIDADENQINLAKKLMDEDRIHIPLIGEIGNIEVQEEFTNSGNNNKININKGTKEELMTLSGVGEVTANKIIDYRSDSKFEKIEDLMLVSGIGEKKFEAIKDSISVN